MSKRILFELYNLSIPGGTGIATYARNLIAQARELGFAREGLLHSNRPIDRKDPLLGEIGYYDARNRQPSTFDRYVTMTGVRAFGVPLGIPTTELRRGAVIDAGQSATSLDALEKIHVANLFMDRARLHFKRYGNAAVLRLPANPDIFHATQAIPLRIRGAKNVYTIHDIVPLRLPGSTLDDKKYFLNMVRHLGRTADLIITVSDASRRDLVEVCGVPPEKIVNTYQPVAFPPHLMEQNADEAARLVEGSFGLKPGSYYLFYGAMEPKKNVGRILEAFLASGTKRKLVIAGGLGWEYEEDLVRIAASKDNIFRIDGGLIKPDERVLHLRYLPLFQLIALVRCARALVFPSLYEGFGLPVAEAMLLGTPVITSDGSALKEVAGGAALLVDPQETRSIMAGLLALDDNDALCEDLRRRGRERSGIFSVEAHGARLQSAYNRLFSASATGGSRLCAS